MCILGISKVLMCQFPYDYIKNKHGNNLRLLFTDTNNLMFAIKTKDSYETFNSNKEIFDLTNYSTKSKLLQKLTNDKFCDKAVSNCYKAQRMCDRAVSTYDSTIKVVPGYYKSREMCDKAVNSFYSSFINFLNDVNIKKCVASLFLKLW